MKELIMTTLTRDELQALVIDSVKACLKSHASQQSVRREEIATPANEAFISKRQAAALLACCTSTIDNHARSGRLRRHYVGKSVKFDRQQVLALAQPHQSTKERRANIGQ